MIPITRCILLFCALGLIGSLASAVESHYFVPTADMCLPPLMEPSALSTTETDLGTPGQVGPAVSGPPASLTMVLPWTNIG